MVYRYFERPMAEAPPSIMQLWERYHKCLVTTDPTESVQIIEQFEPAVLAGAEPPPWMRAVGETT